MIGPSLANCSPIVVLRMESVTNVRLVVPLLNYQFANNGPTVAQTFVAPIRYKQGCQLDLHFYPGIHTSNLKYLKKNFKLSTIISRVRASPQITQFPPKIYFKQNATYFCSALI